MSENQNVTLTLTLNEAQTVFNALVKLPFETVHQLVGNIQDQVSKQLSPQPEQDSN